MPNLEIGHMTHRYGGRQRVYVIVHCQHGTEDDPRPYITEHEEYDRLEPSQRASVVGEAIIKHRRNVRDEFGVECRCAVPDDFTVTP